jgi:DnaJ-class molecular chaperone
MAVKNLYETLGVERSADHETLRKAYRKLARQYHPDLNPGDRAAEERFKEISHAWDVLQDAERRRNYDEFGDVSLESGFDADQARRARAEFEERFGRAGRGGRGGRAGGVEDFEFGGLDDVLSQIFGGGGAGARIRMRGADLHATLELDFLEAIRGGERRVTLMRPDAQGRPVEETITVRFPPGVSDEGELRIPGKGAPGAGGGPPGDLRARVRVRPHPVFRRSGRDLELDLPISVREAILGAQVEIPTLEGRATLSIPPGTDSGVRLRLRGKGVPAARGAAAGDLLARVQIRVPRKLDDAARRAAEALAPAEDRDLRKELFS